MAETTADVRRDIEMTRERMSETLDQLEQKMNVMQIVRDHPWPALAVAVGAGVLLSGSQADVKAAAATVSATRGASGRVGTVLDDVVASLMTGVSAAFAARVEGWVDELKTAIGAPTGQSSRQGFSGGSSGGYGGTSTRDAGAGFGGREVGGSEPFTGASGSSGSFGATGSATGTGASGAGGLSANPGNTGAGGATQGWNRAD